MPRSAYFSKEEIINKALQIIREQGSDALSARSLSKALNCSISPIFTVFKNMEELTNCTRETASKMFSDYVADMSEYTPVFKAFGMRLIRFARQEQNLFSFLFLDSNVSVSGWHPKAKEGLAEVREHFGLNEEQTTDLFKKYLWPYACGLALLSSREPDTYTEELVSEMLSIEFSAALGFLKSGKKAIIPEPTRKDR